MSMHRIRNAAWLLIGLILGATSVSAQLTTKGEPGLKKYPEITFQVNDRNPEAHTEAHFQLKEADKDLKFELKSEVPDDSGYHKDILILWEYLPAKARDGQNKFFRKLILDALPGLLHTEDDLLNVATFGWNSGEKGAPNLRHLLGTSYSADTGGYRLAVRDLKAPTIGKGIDQAHGSELYPAISEGIESLSQVNGRAKVLIVLSAEFPNIYNQNIDVSMVKDQALDADVAIYNIRYKVMSDKYTLDNLARDTYGRSYEANKDLPNEATKTLTGFAESAIQRALGRDYTFKATTATPKDGTLHKISLTGGKDQLDIDYNAPSQSLGEWIGANVALFIGLIVLVIGLGIGIFLLWRKRQETLRLQEEERQKELDEVRKRSIEQESQIDAHNQRVMQMRREDGDRRKQEEEAKRRAEAEAEAKVLLTEMYANGRQPRLTTMVDGQTVTMQLPSPVTAVGRDATSDIQFHLPTMSRNHFQVIYQGGKYLLLDLGSTNGTVLNGSRITQAELRHGDEIMAGDAVLHFYL